MNQAASIYLDTLTVRTLEQRSGRVRARVGIRCAMGLTALGHDARLFESLSGLGGVR